MHVKIVADRAIPFVGHYCGDLGELRLVEARAIDRAALRDADVLVARTVTRIDRALLDGTRVRFVASPASGADHVDLDYLREAGIGYAGARGCNARSVAEYVLSALCAIADAGDLDLRGKCAGVIGCGAVGATVARFLEAIGLACLRNDPPLRAAGHPGDYRDLHELRDADIVTLHVPLTDSGPYPTRALANAEFLSGLKPGVVLVNTARGEVVDEAALARLLDRDPRAMAVLDVWRGEPGVDRGLHARARIGTPHVAGYSIDARLKAAAMTRAAVRAFLGREPDAAPAPELPPPAHADIAIAPGADALEAVRRAVLAAYDVRSDDRRMRPMEALAGAERGAFFAALRRDYPVRREFPAHTVRVRDAAAARMLAELGFAVRTDA